jgi:hypothetical protein
MQLLLPLPLLPLLIFPSDTIMPLLKGAKARTRKGFGQNIKTEMAAGRPQKQAVAIAYSEANESKKKKKMKRK